MAPWGGPYTPERAPAELRHYLGHDMRYGFAPFAVVENDALIGDMGLQRLEDGPRVELLYRLSSTVWRRGPATEASDAILDYGFSGLGLREIVAVIAEDNIRSQRLADRLGFIAGEPGAYYGQRLVLHRITPNLHAGSLKSRRTHPPLTRSQTDGSRFSSGRPRGARGGIQSIGNAK